MPTFPGGTYSGVISMNANLSGNEAFGDYDKEYKDILAAGAKGAQINVPWSALNPTGSTYSLSALQNPYSGLVTLVQDGYEAILLNIPIIAITTRAMPSDIASLDFADPLVKQRVYALINQLLGVLPDQVRYVSFGNEVDTYFASHPTEWGSYMNLVNNAKTYLKASRPGIQVGVTTTFDGATVRSKDQIQKLNEQMDVVILTYYPIDGITFKPRNPDTVSADVDAMVEISGDKSVVIQEWGYPSSSVLGSSEYSQAEFIFNSFTELENQGKAKFPFVSFFKYRDWNGAYVQTFTARNPGDPFFEFMSSLGLKRNDGTSKEAFAVISAWIKR